MPTIWNIEKGGERWRKQKVGRQASKAQRGKELERERKKQRKHFLFEEQHEILLQRRENEKCLLPPE